MQTQAKTIALPADEPQYGGTLFEVGEQDFLITDVNVSLIQLRDGKPLERQRPHLTFSQLDLPGDGAHACWLTGALKMVADTYPLDTPEARTKMKNIFLEAWDYAVKNGYHGENKGGKMVDGVDIARHFINQYAAYDRKVKTYRGKLPRFDVDDPTHLAFYRAVNSGWQLSVGRYTGPTIMKDLLEDGDIDADAKPTGAGVYGHLFNLYAHETTVYAVNDNYPTLQGKEVSGAGFKGVWNNYYLIPHLEAKVQAGMFFPSFYLAQPA